MNARDQTPSSNTPNPLRWIFPDCRHAIRLQSKLLDGAVPSYYRLGLWLHLAVCKWCRRYGRQLRFIRTVARGRAEPILDPMPHKLSDQARHRLKRAIRSSMGN